MGTKDETEVNPEKIARDLECLYPPFCERLEKGLLSLQREVPGICAFETSRTPERQDFLYAKGRTAPGNIVTRARAWGSFHQVCLACDVAVFLDGRWSWDFDKELVKARLLEYGLEPGPSFELGHFQLTGGLKISEAREIAFTDGLLAVWHRVDALISAKP